MCNMAQKAHKVKDETFLLGLYKDSQDFPKVKF